MELVNKIDNKEIYANRAVNDSEGNVIKDTYTKKSDFETWTDEGGHTYVTGLDGKGFNSHWADFAGKDGNGNDLTDKMDSSKLGYDKDGKISSYDGVEFAGQGGTSMSVEFVTEEEATEDNVLYFILKSEPEPGLEYGVCVMAHDSNGDLIETSNLHAYEHHGEELRWKNQWYNEWTGETFEIYADDYGELGYIEFNISSDSDYIHVVCLTSDGERHEFTDESFHDRHDTVTIQIGISN